MYEIMSTATTTTTTTTSSDMDEIIENEVCNRLIRLSCAKMVNSKHERGGAKLHRNLLILHLLRRARDEQQRSAPPSPNGSDEHLEISTRSTHAVIESSLRDADDSDNEEEGDDDDVDVERCDKEKGQLLDLSRGPRSGLSTFNEPIELSVRDEDEIDYCNLRLEPLQLPFGTDAIEAEDLSELSKPSVLVVPQLSPELSCQVGQELSELQAVHQHQPIAVVNRASLVMEANSDNDESAPLYFEISEDEHDPTSSSSESEDDDYEEEDEIDRNTKSPTKMRRRRKRRTSSPPTTAKKCCVEERQLTGLISVFNSGLSVVADQFMGHPPSGTLLQQSPDQIVPSLMRIACNPLICQ